MENKIEQQNNTNKSKTKEAISITIILVLAFALLGFGANLIRKQTPPGINAMNHTSSLMLTAFVLGYLGSALLTIGLMLLQKYLPHKKSGKDSASISTTEKR
jgi:uncharacterized BrkB/YihY/UPF0761 family membrane protein